MLACLSICLRVFLINVCFLCCPFVTVNRILVPWLVLCPLMIISISRASSLTNSRPLISPWKILKSVLKTKIGMRNSKTLNRLRLKICFVQEFWMVMTTWNLRTSPLRWVYYLLPLKGFSLYFVFTVKRYLPLLSSFTWRHCVE